MPTTSNMSLVLPTEGGDADIWDTILNTAFGLIDAHDHTTGRGVKVPSAGLKINADVSWSFGGTNYAITDAKALDFTPVAASTMTSYSSALFSNSSDSNNLYYRNSAGTNVQITDGNTLNVSIVGGIGGDYSSVSALVDYDDATDTYRFRQEVAAAVRQYAKILAADVRLAEYIAAGDPTPPTNFVTLKSPAALAASYTVEWPAAVPGAQALVQSSTTGVLTFSNTIAQAITATDFKNSTELSHQLGAGDDVQGTHTKKLGGTSGALVGWTMVASTNPIVWKLPVKFGDRITSWTVFVDKQTDATGTVQARLYMTKAFSGTIGTESALGTLQTNSSNAPGAISLQNTGINQDVAVGFEYYVVFNTNGGVAPTNDTAYHCEYGTTRP